MRNWINNILICTVLLTVGSATAKAADDLVRDSLSSASIAKSELYIGETSNITVTFTTSPQRTGTPTYSSAKTDLVEVTADGVVTAKSTGGKDAETVIITVTLPATDTYKETQLLVPVTVKKRPVTMTLEYSKSTMTYGDELPVLSYCTLTDGVDKTTKVTGTVNYSSSTTGLSVSASTGEVTAVTKAGKATITAFYAGSDTYLAATATFDITVDKAKTTLSFGEEQYEAQVNESFSSPMPGLTPDVPNPTITFSFTSDTEGIITLNASTGEVTIGNMTGTAVVTATYAGDDCYLGSTASYILTVSKKPSPGLTVTLSSKEFYVDDVSKMTVTTNSTNGYTIESSDTDVLTVDEDGNIKAVGAGTATVTVTSIEDDTYRRSVRNYKVTVKRYTTEISKFAYSSWYYYTDNTEILKPTVVVLNTDNKSQIADEGLLSFSENQPTVLTVDPTSGEITIVGSGVAAVDVVYEGNYKYEPAEMSVWIYVFKAVTPGSFIRLRGDDYEYLSMQKDGDGYKVVSTSKADASSIIWYGEDGSLLFYESGRYLNGADKSVADVVDYGASGTKFTFSHADEDKDQYADYDDYYFISVGDVKMTDGSGSEYWTVVDVESLPFQFKSAGNGYATFYTPQDVRVPAGVAAYYPVSRTADEADTDKQVITLKQVSQNRVPCYTPVILYTDATDVDYQFNIIDHTTTPDDLWDGMVGTLPAIKTQSVYNGTNYPYTLQPTSSSVGFYPWKSDKHEVIESFRCYIPGDVTASSAGFRFVFSDDDDTTGIVDTTDKENNDSKVIYNLQGMAVGTDLNSLPAGIYIQGGKKVVVRN